MLGDLILEVAGPLFERAFEFGVFGGDGSGDVHRAENVQKMDLARVRCTGHVRGPCDRCCIASAGV